MKLLTLPSAIRRRWSSERGAVLVEAALAVPLLMLVILGSIEAGLAWEAKSTTTSGVRTGLLRAASIGDQPETDLRILQSIIGEIGADDVGGLEWVVIFDATNSNHSATIESCRQAEAGGGVFGLCNTYGSGTQFADIVAGTVTQANFDDGGNVVGSGYTCDSTKIDSNWCAPSRLVNGDIQIGVALKYQHDWFTGIFPGDGVDFEDYSTSSTFIGEGSDITPSSGAYVPPTSIAYDAGSFENGVPLSSKWSTSAQIQSAPANSARKYLGNYGYNDSVELTLTDLPSHTQICVTFDLIIIGGWENSGSYIDYFELDVDSVNVLKETYAKNNPPADATDINTLGQVSNHNRNFVVPITQCVPHTSDDVVFSFGSDMSADLPDEGWGLDNVVVEHY